MTNPTEPPIPLTLISTTHWDHGTEYGFQCGRCGYDVQKLLAPIRECPKCKEHTTPESVQAESLQQAIREAVWEYGLNGLAAAEDVIKRMKWGNVAHRTPDCDGLNSSAKVQIDSELNLSSEISIHEATLEDIIRGRFQLLGYENPITDAREAMNAIRPYLRTREPVSVKPISLMDCAMALQGNQRIKLGSDLQAIAKAVLDAAGVKYYD